MSRSRLTNHDEFTTTVFSSVQWYAIWNSGYGLFSEYFYSRLYAVSLGVYTLAIVTSWTVLYLWLLWTIHEMNCMAKAIKQYLIYYNHTSPNHVSSGFTLLICDPRDSFTYICWPIWPMTHWPIVCCQYNSLNRCEEQFRTRKLSCRWQTRATQKHAKNCSNSTRLQHCRW